MVDARPRFDALFERTHRDVLAYALRRTREPADAEDVAAETYAIAWRRFADVPDGDLALPWLYGVARRVLANQRRGADRRGGLIARLFQRTLTVALPPDLDDGPATVALAALRVDDRELLQLVAWEGLDHAGVAAALGISVNAVAIRLHRARRRFAEVYERLVEQDSNHLKGTDAIRTSIPAKGGLTGRPRQETK